MATTIAPDVADVIQRSSIAGPLLTLPEGKLDRDLYVQVNKVLTALGGKWDRKRNGHVFDVDPATRIADALGSGKAVSRQQTLQFFETPANLADELVAYMKPQPGESCLEPSAGHGRIVAALSRAGADDITAIEIDADNMSKIKAQGLATRLLEGDFLALPDDTVRYDVIAMNPPFTKNQDIRHVRRAYSLLRPGGRLAAIVGEHGFIGREADCVNWRVWLNEVDATIEKIDAGAFKESGTAVSTRMVVIIKPA